MQIRAAESRRSVAAPASALLQKGAALAAALALLVRWQSQHVQCGMSAVHGLLKLHLTARSPLWCRATQALPSQQCKGRSSLKRLHR